ncbi:MAG: alpha/beta hydrolase [Deltaproteobacteria bacterium]|nr:alpha/beta hydrolase [Deltaproteobacteria bacterium]
MNVEMKYAKLFNGFRCYYQHWFPDKPKALLIMVHGLGDHIGRSNEFVSFLGCKGYACALYDQRGHGLSEGKRGHIHSFDTWLDDLDAFISFSKNELNEDVPIFLIGGSLGGLIALNYVQKTGKKIRGLVAVSPAIIPTIAIPNWLRKFVRTVGKVLPSLTVDNRLNWDHMSNDPEEKKALIDDQLFTRRISFRAAIEIERKLEYVMTLACRIYIPTLMIAGAGDLICDPVGAKRFTDGLSSADKQCIIYDGMLHDVIHDVGRKRVMEDIENWIAKRIVKQ